MKVVSDTGPINYLLLIGRVELIHDLYGEVTMPEAVLRELQHSQAPVVVGTWARQIPFWVKVASPKTLLKFDRILDAGELEAISLAAELKADLLLVDEADARAAALSLGMAHVGTLGIVVHAARIGILDKPRALAAIEALKLTNIRIHPRILATALMSIQAIR